MIINRAILIPLFTGQFGGPYNVIMDLTPHLEEMGVNTKVFSTSFIAQQGKERTVFFEKKSKGFLIYRFDSYLNFREYRISLKLIPFLLRQAKNIDIFHSNAVRTFQEDIGSFISLIKNKPLIITPHGGININYNYSDKIPKMIHDKTVGFLKKKFLNPHFIAVAKNEIPIIKKFGVDVGHIHYIPNGVNTDIFKEVDSTYLKKKYDLENSDVILFVGRIDKIKGVDILIKILNYVVKKNKNVKLMIIGGDSGYLPIVQSLIKKYDLSKNIIITGYIPKNKLPEYYSSADLVVYPSKQEIFGLVLCEAGACGKAVIGSDIMGPSEIIIDGKTGYTSDFKNPEKVCDLIVDLLDDKKHLRQLGENGLKRVKEKYSWKKAAESHLKLYKKLLNLN